VSGLNCQHVSWATWLSAMKTALRRCFWESVSSSAPVQIVLRILYRSSPEMPLPPT